jgi:hypothetical protein
VMALDIERAKAWLAEHEADEPVADEVLDRAVAVVLTHSKDGPK